MEFVNPERLWLLLVVAAFAVAYVAVLRWRRRATVRFTQIDLLDRIAPARPAWRRHVVASLQLIGLAVGVVAVARPITTTVERTVSEGRIIIDFDVSLSMQATDVAPNRITAAQQAAKDFIAQVADDVEIGLVSFAGSVAVEVPPTLDRTAVLNAVDGLQMSDSTAIGDALITSTDLLVQLQGSAGDDSSGEDDVAPGAIVLLTDGETTFGRSTAEGAQAAADAAVPVFTIAFGTPDGFIVNPNNGDTVAVPVQPEPLREAAQVTGGQAYEAASADELADAYARIEDLLGETLGDAVERVTEQTWMWAAGAVATLAAAWALSLWWLRGMV